MTSSMKKKIIIISVINLLFAILFVKLILSSVTYSGLVATEIITLISCGIINSFFIKKDSLWQHTKFFIIFSIITASLFEIVYLFYYFTQDPDDFMVSISTFVVIVKLAFIFFIGTLLGAALKEIYDRIKIITSKKSLS